MDDLIRRSLKNIHHFINHRKYETERNKESNVDIEFNRLMKDGYLKIEARAQDGHLIFIIMLSPESDYHNHGPYLRNLMDKFLDKSDTDIIFIVHEAFFKKSQILTIINERNEIRNRIFTYPYYMFVCNIPEHESVAKYELVDPNEVKALLKYNKIRPIDLQKMLHDDIISIWYGFEVGNVVKAAKASETSGRFTTYRLIV
jgi:DNA-directed RNA polymerase subunit H (RpoH/RPB5)